MELFDLITSDVIARNAGMDRSARHADENCPAWTEQAYAWIKNYSADHPTFISEECTAAAEKAGLPSPTDARAWGHPFRRASHDMIIKRIGFGISNRRHQSPTPRWQSMHPNFWRAT